MRISEDKKMSLISSIVGATYDGFTVLDLNNRQYLLVTKNAQGKFEFSAPKGALLIENWIDDLANTATCHAEDCQQLRDFLSLNHLRVSFAEKKDAVLSFNFRRKISETDVNFRNVEIKVIFSEDDDQNPLAIVLLRDVLTSDPKLGMQLTLVNNVDGVEYRDLVGRRKLLIVEDNMLNRELLKEILSNRYTIYEAENGLEGLELLREHYSELSVVLLDVHMPVMDGHEFLEHVSKDSLLSQIPVIVMTSLGKDEEERCLSLGATDFISKPYNHNVIKSRINSIIRLRESVAALNMAEVDELTGLYTRQAFCHHADVILKKHPDKVYDIIMSDIVDFRLFNEKYGNEIGNEILRNIADDLKTLSRFGVLVGRHSEDRFVSMFEHKDYFDDAMLISNYEKMLVDKPYQIYAKFGVYDNVDHEVSASVLCDRCFMALQTVKHQFGKVFARFDDVLLNKIKRQQMIETNMNNAIINNEFKVYYQPKHDIASGKIVGAEALIRWINPEYGFISPAEFIPLFEKNGFISQVDFFVWERTCENLARWIKTGIPIVPISVNASKIDFEVEDYLGVISQPVKEYGIDPKYLHIEVTESLFANRVEELSHTLNLCRDYGFKIELDDFGTGYSSLNTLGSLPLDVIKLDMSFMRQLHDPRRIRVLSMCINLAKSLNLKTVCEGVENEEQIDLLRELDVDCIQGYYYSKALPEEEFEEYLRKTNS